MELPIELSELICTYLYVTDVRILARLCKSFTSWAKRQIDKKIFSNKPECFHDYLQYRCVEKFTIELAFDQYPIPESFYIKTNKVICSVHAYLGNLPLLRQAVSKGCNITENTFICAVESGQIDILKYCCTKFGEPSESTLDEMIKKAVICGYNRMLDYFFLDESWEITVQLGYWQTRIGFYAAEYDRSDALQWMVDSGYGLDEFIFTYAIENKKYSVIRWGLKNFDKMTQLAIACDDPVVLQMINELK